MKLSSASCRLHRRLVQSRRHRIGQLRHPPRDSHDFPISTLAPPNDLDLGSGFSPRPRRSQKSPPIVSTSAVSFLGSPSPSILNATISSVRDLGVDLALLALVFD
ncbi:hypothetical protein ACFE04_011399 [Oxalis oulophora]